MDRKQVLKKLNISEESVRQSGVVLKKEAAEKIEASAKQAQKKLASSLSKIWEYSTQKEIPIGIITAFRKRYTYPENTARNLRLKRDLLSNAMTFIEIKGHFIEGYKTPQAKDVAENSFFVLGNMLSPEDFKERLIALGNKYNQDSVLFVEVENKEAILVGTQNEDEDGNPVEPGFKNEWDLGPFHPRKINEFYSTWKGKPFSFTHTGSVSKEGHSGVLYLSMLQKVAPEDWEELYKL